MATTLCGPVTVDSIQQQSFGRRNSAPNSSPGFSLRPGGRAFNNTLTGRYGSQRRGSHGARGRNSGPTSPNFEFEQWPDQSSSQTQSQRAPASRMGNVSSGSSATINRGYCPPPPRSPPTTIKTSANPPEPPSTPISRGLHTLISLSTLRADHSFHSPPHHIPPPPPALLHPNRPPPLRPRRYHGRRPRPLDRRVP
jgi:hypothetical protein